MNSTLVISLISFGVAALVITFVVFNNTVVKTKNVKLEIEVSSLTKRLQLEKNKTKELSEVLEYIKQTGRIPKKVLDNTYEYKNIKNINKDPQLDNLRDKFKTRLTMQEEKDISKEELESLLRSQQRQQEELSKTRKQ